MSLTTLRRGVWWGLTGEANVSETTSLSSGESQLIDATGEKYAMVGRFWHPDGGTKSIRKIIFRVGSITSAGGSAVDISLQNVSLTAGPPMQPDETQDEKVSSVLLSAIAANSVYTTAALSADRSVSVGDRLAVVIEYDGAGRLGSDALNIIGQRATGTTVFQESAYNVLKTGGTWAVPSTGQVVNVIFECSDGTFGTLDGAFPNKNTFSIAYNSGSSPNEYALPFDVPVECEIDAFRITMSIASGADFEAILYEGTTALATISGDANSFNAVSLVGWFLATLATPQTLSPSTTYYLSLKPTTANNVTAYYFDMNAANHFNVHAGSSTWLMSSRSGGAWSNYGSSLRRMRAAIRISKVHNSSGPFAVHNSQLILPPSVIGY